MPVVRGRWPTSPALPRDISLHTQTGTLRSSPTGSSSTIGACRSDDVPVRNERAKAESIGSSRLETTDSHEVLDSIASRWPVRVAVSAQRHGDCADRRWQLAEDGLIRTPRVGPGVAFGRRRCVRRVHPAARRANRRRGERVHASDGTYPSAAASRCTSSAPFSDVTGSAWRWTTFHSPSSRRNTVVARSA